LRGTSCVDEGLERCVCEVASETAEVRELEGGEELVADGEEGEDAAGFATSPGAYDVVCPFAAYAVDLALFELGRRLREIDLRFRERSRRGVRSDLAARYQRSAAFLDEQGCDRISRQPLRTIVLASTRDASEKSC
jgi:hypothetical protein